MAKKTKKVFIGIDPGNGGGISIVEGKKVQILDIPITIVKSGKKNKKQYNVSELCDIFSEIKKSSENKEIVLFLEKVHVMGIGGRSEGSVSSFNFGRGIGQLEGIVSANGIEINYATPQKWKKAFPELITSEMTAIKEEIKIKKAEMKASIEEIGQKKLNKKQGKKEETAIKKEVTPIIEKMNRQYKSLAKGSARGLAAKLLPEFAEKFKRVKDDGRAESLLIALFGKKTHDMV